MRKTSPLLLCEVWRIFRTERLKKILFSEKSVDRIGFKVYLVFSAVCMLTKNRIDNKSSVTALNNQLFLRFDWNLWIRYSLQYHVNNRHLVFMRQNAVHHNSRWLLGGLISGPFFLSNVGNVNGNIPPGLKFKCKIRFYITFCCFLCCLLLYIPSHHPLPPLPGLHDVSYDRNFWIDKSVHNRSGDSL